MLQQIILINRKFKSIDLNQQLLANSTQLPNGSMKFDEFDKIVTFIRCSYLLQ